ncbi:MAG: hypothetical protein ACQEP1_01670 [Nanobdellota archaeon]
MYTTIAVSPKVKEAIKEYGNKGETYDQILSKILKSAKDRQIQELLMDTEGYTTAKDALKRAKKKWQ